MQMTSIYILGLQAWSELQTLRAATRDWGTPMGGCKEMQVMITLTLLLGFIFDGWFRSADPSHFSGCSRLLCSSRRSSR